MKFRWIDLAFQPLFYVLCLTIALAVCSTDGSDDFISNFNHTVAGISSNLTKERWNVNVTDEQNYGNLFNSTQPEYWSPNNSTTNRSMEIFIFERSNYSSTTMNTTTDKKFPFHKATFNPPSQITNSPGSTTLSSLWPNIGRPSAKKFHTGMPIQREFSSKFEREEPWRKSDTLTAHGPNHFNSIVNVKVDSSAETLDKMIRLEAMITRKMNEMGNMAKIVVADLKSEFNRLEKTIQLRNNKIQRSTFDVQEMKQHLESLIDIKIQTLLMELKKNQCESNVQMDNEPINAIKLESRNSLTTEEPFKVEGRHLGSNKDGLADWRAKRTKLMERWESHFQRGLSTTRKSTKRSTRNLS